jgi:hypothetical protein
MRKLFLASLIGLVSGVVCFLILVALLAVYFGGLAGCFSPHPQRDKA